MVVVVLAFVSLSFGVIVMFVIYTARVSGAVIVTEVLVEVVSAERVPADVDSCAVSDPICILTLALVSLENVYVIVITKPCALVMVGETTMPSLDLICIFVLLTEAFVYVHMYALLSLATKSPAVASVRYVFGDPLPHESLLKEIADEASANVVLPFVVGVLSAAHALAFPTMTAHSRSIVLRICCFIVLSL